MRIVHYSNEPKQGSPEWLALKAGRFSASNSKDVVGTDKKLHQYATIKAGEAVSGTCDEIGVSWQMRWGTENEPNAAEIYKQSMGVELIEHVGQPVDGDLLSLHTWASPDRLIPSKSMGLEIKCPPSMESFTNFLLMRNGFELKSVNLGYFAQVQMCMLAYEVEKWDFMVYHPKFPPNACAYVVTVHRDESFIAGLVQRLEQAIFVKLEKISQIKQNLGLS
jgi:hypothetical protein